MRLLRKFRLQAGWLLRRSRAEVDLTDELQDYIERQTERHVADGLAPKAARLAAMREMGGVEQLKEECRDARSSRFMEALFQDSRYGLRQLRRNPGFTATAVLTLALGIAVNTTIFSLVSSLLLRKPPIQGPDRVVMLLSRHPGTGSATDEANRMPLSAPDFLDWRAQAKSFSGMAASSLQSFTIGSGTQPERVSGAEVSANYFQVLGVSPILGRAFKAAEDRAGRDRVAVIREDLWKGRFAADPQVIGKTVNIDGETYSIIGVMPDSFQRMWLFPAEVWTPLVFTAEQLQPAARKSGMLDVFARLRSGVGEREALAEVIGIARRSAAAHPESQKGWSGNLMTVQRYAIEESNTKTALLFLQATVAFVLLIACANVINLLLARSSARQREFAIRAALGAGRFRVARQLLAECLILGLLGGGLGLLFTFFGLRMLRSGLNWNDYMIRAAEQLAIDGKVLLFTVVLSLATALVFGLAPAVQLSRDRPNSGLKENSRSSTAGREHHRLQNLMVIGQLALSVVLLTGAAIFVTYFLQEVRMSPGLNPRNVLTASVQLSGSGYKTAAQKITFYQNVLRRVAASPEVLSVAAASDLPFTFPNRARVVIEGQPVLEKEKQIKVGYFAVSPDYFSATQIPVREGRDFKAFDKAGSHRVVIVDQAFATKFFPHENPLGRRIQLGLEDSESAATHVEWSEVVGVVANVNEFLGQLHPRPHVFEPFLQAAQNSMSLFVRLRGEPGSFATSLREAVYSVDRNQPVTNVRTMRRVIQDAGQGDDLMAELMGAFAGIALIMAALGTYGLISYLVARRTQEIGVRVAIGASQQEVLMLILRNSMSLILIGVAVGVVISLALPRLTAAIFDDFHVSGGWIIGGTSLAVVVTAVVSSYVPAHRASKLDPLVALRSE